MFLAVFACAYLSIQPSYADSVSYQYNNLRCSQGDTIDGSPTLTTNIESREDGDITFGVSMSFNLGRKRKPINDCTRVKHLIEHLVLIETQLKTLELEQAIRSVENQTNDEFIVNETDDW